MDTSGLLTIKPIKSELIPPVDPETGEQAEPTGEVFKDARGDSHIVYTMSFPDLEATTKNKQPVMDLDTGKQQTRKGDQGPYLIWHRPTVFSVAEFILERASGEIRIQRDFRPTAGELERAKERRLVAEFESGLAVEATKRGITASELVSRVMGGLEKGLPEPEGLEGPTEDVDEALPEIVHVGGGYYNVTLDGKPLSEKNLTKKEAEDLAEMHGPVAAGPDDSY